MKQTNILLCTLFCILNLQSMDNFPPLEEIICPTIFTNNNATENSTQFNSGLVDIIIKEHNSKYPTSAPSATSTESIIAGLDRILEDLNQNDLSKTTKQLKRKRTTTNTEDTLQPMHEADNFTLPTTSQTPKKARSSLGSTPIQKHADLLNKYYNTKLELDRAVATTLKSIDSNKMQVLLAKTCNLDAPHLPPSPQDTGEAVITNFIHNHLDKETLALSTVLAEKSWHCTNYPFDSVIILKKHMNLKSLSPQQQKTAWIDDGNEIKQEIFNTKRQPTIFKLKRHKDILQYNETTAILTLPLQITIQNIKDAFRQKVAELANPQITKLKKKTSTLCIAAQQSKNS